MNVLFLKAVALATMIIDHYGAIFHSGENIYRIIGRIAFPVYCFLLVEGYFHTSNVKKYGKRLLLFAFISEIPFDLAFYGSVGFAHQNIFFTLFIGLAAIYFLEKKEQKYNFDKSLVIAAAGILAMVLSVDYSIMGVIYILSFYFTRNFSKKRQLLYMAGIMLFINLMSSPLQQFSLLALPFIYFYNGEPGLNNKFLQILFYAAYPLHLLLFYFLNK
ncbi:TraX family protein [Sedimentibacter sp. B4]|uniref:TraX family protein n=1 Tax=Sedimentibacter sp. B4 TaxID=304766 RepID=UPI00030D1FC4|nr:TraX family protein [Sedimentibacter sp. B4]